MTIFKFGGGFGGTTQITQDHIFATEAERDAYFNPDRLDELIMGTPIVVTISGRPRFQTWGSSTPADAAAYLNTNWILSDEVTLALADNEIPIKMPGSNVLSGSGFMINPSTMAMEGTRDIETSAKVTSGLATFGLAQAHDIISAAENVAITNVVTDTDFHPTWQTATQDGDWASVQRTPTAAAVIDHPFQVDVTQDVTNPVVAFDGLAFDHRIYAITLTPTSSITNAVFTLARLSGSDFINYWQSRPIDLVGGGPQKIPGRPFIDLEGGQRYQITATSEDGDVVLKGNAGGLPAMLFDYVPWRDDQLATRRFVGDLRLDGSVQITADVDITAANLEEFTRKLWLVTATSQVDVSIADNLDLRFFAVYVVGASAAIRLTAVPRGVVRIDGESDKRYLTRFGAIFVRTLANRYDPIGQNGFIGNFLDLSDTPGSYGAAGQLVAINPAANGLRFINPPSVGSSTFASLTDTAASITALDYVRGNAAGDALEFVDPLIFEGTVEITGDVTVTAANAATYNRRIWLITGGSRNVTINAGAGLTFFAIYVRVLTATGTITPAASVRVNNSSTAVVYQGREAATYFAITTDRYMELNRNVAGITIQDGGTQEGESIGTLNFADNLAVTVAAGVATVTGSAAGTAGVIIQDGGVQEGTAIGTINFGDNISVDVSSGVATVTGSVLGAASTNWDHASLPSGRIPSNNRRWYSYTGTGNATRAMPTESGITSGWHSFFGNDSTTATLFLTGDFRGSLTQIALLPQQGCEVSYNGSQFLEGPARDVITVSSFPDWSGNPLRHDTSYSGFSTNSNGLNLNDVDARAALLNRNVRVSTRSDNDFQFDLEPLDSGNFADIPIGAGFGVIANGPQEVNIRTASNDTLTRGGRTHNFSNPVRLSPGAAITFVRSGADTWSTTIQSGTITGGT